MFENCTTKLGELRFQRPQYKHAQLHCITFGWPPVTSLCTSYSYLVCKLLSQATNISPTAVYTLPVPHLTSPYLKDPKRHTHTRAAHHLWHGSQCTSRSVIPNKPHVPPSMYPLWSWSGEEHSCSCSCFLMVALHQLQTDLVFLNQRCF